MVNVALSKIQIVTESSLDERGYQLSGEAFQLLIILFDFVPETLYSSLGQICRLVLMKLTVTISLSGFSNAKCGV